MGATEDFTTTIDVGAFSGYTDKRVVELATEALKMLGACIGNARAVAKDRESSPPLEILLGLSLLVFAEFQALLMLCTAGLERPARIHMRSVCEYKVRADLLLGDKNKADEFIFAAAAELEYLGALISADSKDIDAAKIRFLGATGSPEQSKREKNVLGGDMRTILKNSSGDKAYGASFAWPSAFSHGSILALGEVSRSLENSGPNFQNPLLRDGGGFGYINTAVSVSCHFTSLLVKHFRVAVSSQLADVLQRQAALAAEVGPANPHTTAKPTL